MPPGTSEITAVISPPVGRGPPVFTISHLRAPGIPAPRRRTPAAGQQRRNAATPHRSAHSAVRCAPCPTASRMVGPGVPQLAAGGARPSGACCWPRNRSNLARAMSPRRGAQDNQRPHPCPPLAAPRAPRSRPLQGCARPRACCGAPFLAADIAAEGRADVRAWRPRAAGCRQAADRQAHSKSSPPADPAAPRATPGPSAHFPTRGPPQHTHARAGTRTRAAAPPQLCRPQQLAGGSTVRPPVGPLCPTALGVSEPRLTERAGRAFGAPPCSACWALPAGPAASGCAGGGDGDGAGARMPAVPRGAMPHQLRPAPRHKQLALRAALCQLPSSPRCGSAGGCLAPRLRPPG